MPQSIACENWPRLAETLTATSTYAARRDDQVAVLTDPRVRQRIADLGIELTTYACAA